MIAARAINESEPLIKRRVFISNLGMSVARTFQHNRSAGCLKGNEHANGIKFRRLVVNNRRAAEYRDCLWQKLKNLRTSPGGSTTRRPLPLCGGRPSRLSQPLFLPT